MLVTILVVLILLALALYGTSLLSSRLDGTIILLIQVVIVVVAIIYIARAAGIA